MRSEERNSESLRKLSEIILTVIGVIFLGALIYFIFPSLSPFVLIISIVFIFYPLRHYQLIRRIIWLAVLLFIVWLIDTLFAILAPFLIALILTYLLNPIVSIFEKKGISRLIGTLLVLVLLCGILVIGFVFLVPLVIEQFQAIIASISIIVKDVTKLIREGEYVEYLVKFGIPAETVRATISDLLPSRIENILKSLFEGVFNLLTSVSMVITQIVNLVIIPFVIFYLLKDFPRIKQQFRIFIPEQHRELVEVYLSRTNQLLGRYFRGAIIVALIQGFIATVILSLIGVNYALVLGIMTAILDFIPYVGLLVSLVVSCIVALFSGEPSLVKVLAVIIMYLSQKLFENVFLAPKIIGESVGVHPVLLIMSLFVFGYFLGFIGLLIAVPTTAVLMMVYRMWEERRLEKQLLVEK